MLHNQTDDIRVRGYEEMVTPAHIKNELPVTDQALATIVEGRRQIGEILRKNDDRILVVVGPCSIHDEAAAYDYAERLKAVQPLVSDVFLLVMRVYFEKPRTALGWKGLVNDPDLDKTFNIPKGLRKSRRILIKINEMGLPAATEMLEMITPQYLAELVSWSAIGARTTESQTHRELASGLSMPVGFKNGTDGSLEGAVNAIIAAQGPQHFLGINQNGQTSIVKTSGNDLGHMVLRGGKRPNYDLISIEEARLMLMEKGLPEVIVVDCSHANSRKKFEAQGAVWKNVIEQRVHGNDALVGLMLESNIHEGAQAFKLHAPLQYGVSITDACISWETTEELLLSGAERLRAAK